VARLTTLAKPALFATTLYREGAAFKYIPENLMSSQACKAVATILFGRNSSRYSQEVSKSLLRRKPTYEFLILHRLRDNQPIPAINQDFVYAVFCQLIDRGGTAPQWIKDGYQEFRPLVNQQLY
jgi:hypothetical protein